ncbi:MAG: DUF2059 domain-containing protein [Desulfosalsimonadaceae bacterium]|nr:DUF2059 domain-containing protein [Desulfosalsimonadaceae bacterium]
MSSRTIISFMFLLSALVMPSIGYCEQREDILTFLKVTGMEEGISRGAKLYRDEIKKNYPKAPESFYKSLDSDLKKYVTEMKSYYVKLYSKEFSKEDMKSILSFLETPAGKKFVVINTEKLPQIYELTNKKMKEVDERVEKRLKDMKRP